MGSYNLKRDLVVALATGILIEFTLFVFFYITVNGGSIDQFC